MSNLTHAQEPQNPQHCGVLGAVLRRSNCDVGVHLTGNLLLTGMILLKK